MYFLTAKLSYISLDTCLVVNKLESYLKFILVFVSNSEQEVGIDCFDRKYCDVMCKCQPRFIETFQQYEKTLKKLHNMDISIDNRP